MHFVCLRGKKESEISIMIYFLFPSSFYKDYGTFENWDSVLRLCQWHCWSQFDPNYLLIFPTLFISQTDLCKYVFPMLLFLLSHIWDKQPSRMKRW